MGVAEVASGTAAAGVAGAGLAGEVPSGGGAGLPAAAGLQRGRECECALCKGECRGDVFKARGTPVCHCWDRLEGPRGITVIETSH